MPSADLRWIAMPARVATVATLVALAAGCNNRDPAPGEATRASGNRSASTDSHEAEPQYSRRKPKPKIVGDEERLDAIRRAIVWRQPRVAVRAVDFAWNPELPREMDCRFKVSELGGTTPKFNCVLDNGDDIRVKYGRTGELPGEVASTRLLRAFGFGADEVDYVQRLRCFGCPKEPFSTMKAVEITQAERFYKRMMLSYDKSEVFEWVTVERRFEGRPIEAERVAGWNMFELDLVDPSKGGAPRAHVDALRLLAVFLAHWDNKPDNQRLVCLSQNEWGSSERCERPFLLLQDLGATFGPHKVNLKRWKEAPIWVDRASCLTSMTALPYNGATFKPVHISEEGRQLVASLLTSLSDRQLVDLFAGARFDQPLGLIGRGSAVLDWVDAFKQRARIIADGPRCSPT